MLRRNFSSIVGSPTNATGLSNSVQHSTSPNTPPTVPVVRSAFQKTTNKVSTRKYTMLTFLPKFLYEQFSNLANLWFLFVSIAQQIPGISPTGKWTTLGPLLVILTIAAIREIYEDFKRYREDKKINKSVTKSWRVSGGGVGEWVDTYWQDLRPGDIVKIFKDAFIPADVIVLGTSEAQNTCHIQTSSLDGETNLKLRQADPDVVRYFCKFPETPNSTKGIPTIQRNAAVAIFSVERPNRQLYKFDGNVALPAHARRDSIESDTGTTGSFDSKTLRPLSTDHLLLRGSKLSNTKFAIGFVIYTGLESKIMKNSRSLPIKQSNVQKQTNIQIGYLFAIMLAMSIISIVGTWLKTPDVKERWFIQGSSSKAPPLLKQLLTFLILYNAIVPISLIVTLEIVKMSLAGFIGQDLEMYDEESESFCTAKTSNLVEELGQVKYIFSDKTGTLTRNIMEFKFATVQGNVINFDEIVEDTEKRRSVLNPTKPPPDSKLAPMKTPLPALFFKICATCHTVVPELVDEDEQAPGKETIVYQASSPDEGALVEAAQKLGFEFFERLPRSITIRLPNGDTESYQTLATLEFTSARQRMSVVLRENFGSHRIWLFSKGSDAVMMPRLTSSSTESTVTQSHLDNFAKQGLRTLVFACKIIPETDYVKWNERHVVAQALISNREKELEQVYETVENDLVLVGASAIEDKLQEKVPETIENLQHCGVHIWMLTGDKVETAQNIGFSSRLLHPERSFISVITGTSMKAVSTELSTTRERYEMKIAALSPDDSEKCQGVIIISGGALRYALSHKLRSNFLEFALKCRTVICARVSPSQKADVVKLVQAKVGKRCITLAIGDGANDVPMIQSAHIGIGISGKEGLQAANSSDYSIPQFRFLERLLLVHGVWNYYRVTKCILYSFYKNIILHLSQLWFAPHNLYSGQNLFERWSLASYNAAFTMLSPFAIGIFEKPFTAKQLKTNSDIYRWCQDGEKFNTKLFWVYMLNAAYHSLFLYFLTSNTISHEVPDSDGRVAGLTFIGNMVYGNTIMLATIKAQLETTQIGWHHFFLIWTCPICWFCYLYGYSSVFPEVTFGDGLMSGQAHQVLTSPVFWLSFVIFPLVVLFPDIWWKVWKETKMQYRSRQLELARIDSEAERKATSPTNTAGFQLPVTNNNNNNNNNKFDESDDSHDRRDSQEMHSKICGVAVSDTRRRRPRQADLDAGNPAEDEALLA